MASVFIVEDVHVIWLKQKVVVWCGLVLFCGCDRFEDVLKVKKHFLPQLLWTVRSHGRLITRCNFL